VFCLYAQDPGEKADVYDEEPRGFFGTMLSYLDNPKVTSRHLERKRIFELKLFDLEVKFGNNIL
jgi:hypothetical protein